MIFFSDWTNLLRIGVIGVSAYIGLIIILRVSGNRTLSKMNSFDFIVTIALGSTFSSAILDKTVALADALFAFSVLVGLQFLTTWASVRSKRIDSLVKSDPVMLFWGGRFLEKSMNSAHVTKEEVLASIRAQGYSTTEEVGFVVLESNGKIVAVNKKGTSALSL